MPLRLLIDAVNQFNSFLLFFQQVGKLILQGGVSSKRLLKTHHALPDCRGHVHPGTPIKPILNYGNGSARRKTRTENIFKEGYHPVVVTRDGFGYCCPFGARHKLQPKIQNCGLIIELLIETVAFLEEHSLKHNRREG